MAQENIDSPSGVGITAVLVAEARAAETARSDRLFADPYAEAFVNAAMTGSQMIRLAMTEKAPSESVREARLAAVAARTRFFDDYLGSAVQSGITQVVLLAAGLDARAFRLRWPASVRLWELDLPGVLNFKDRVVAETGAIASCKRYVTPVDLRDDWTASLVDAGFDRSLPTAWLAEGLLMYLGESERDVLLNRVGALSKGGSRIGLDHRAGFISTPTLASPNDPSGKRAAAHLAELAASAASDRSLADPEGWLIDHGWRAGVFAADAIIARYGRPVPDELSKAGMKTSQGWLATGDLVAGEG